MHKLALTLMCAYPLATLALTSNAVVAEEGIEARTHNGTEVMKQEPEKAVPAERVFRRPTIVFKNKEKKAEEEAKEKEKFLFPSLAFMAHFDQWKLRLGDVVFLQDNVFSLFKKHPDCRRIQSSWSDYSGRVACRNTSKFLAEGDEVIFSYANVNEVLTGATYTFKSRQRADQFAKRITDTLDATGTPYFKEIYAANSVSYDTPMFTVSVHEAQTGYMVSINAHFQKRMLDAETYAKARLQKIEFGSLTVGVTKIDDIPQGDALPKVCHDVTNHKDMDRREFYGTCFDFPYEAHMQLDFNPETGILETAVLSPIGVTTGSLLEEMLTKRFGFSKFCRRLQSDVSLVSIKEAPERGRIRVTRMKGRPASLFAGTCENPIIFSTEMRYVFENRLLRKEEVDAAYERRKRAVDRSEEHSQAFDARMSKMKGFFE